MVPICYRAGTLLLSPNSVDWACVTCIQELDSIAGLPRKAAAGAGCLHPDGLGRPNRDARGQYQRTTA
jgi:hypothetical protein